MKSAYRVLKTSEWNVYLFSEAANLSLFNDTVTKTDPFLAQARDEACRCGLVIPDDAKVKAFRAGDRTKAVLFLWGHSQVGVSSLDFGYWEPFTVGSRSSRLRTTRGHADHASAYVKRLEALRSSDDATLDEAFRDARSRKKKNRQSRRLPAEGGWMKIFPTNAPAKPADDGSQEKKLGSARGL